MVEDARRIETGMTGHGLPYQGETHPSKGIYVFTAVPFCSLAKPAACRPYSGRHHSERLLVPHGHKLFQVKIEQGIDYVVAAIFNAFFYVIEGNQILHGRLGAAWRRKVVAFQIRC